VVVGSVFKRRICGAVGDVGGGFRYHGCGNLVFCDYYGVVYGYMGRTEVLEGVFEGGKGGSTALASSLLKTVVVGCIFLRIRHSRTVGHTSADA